MKLKIFLLVAALCVLSAAETRAQSYAITNARIVTVSGPTIEKGTVVVRNGLIDAVGANLQPPADARVIDGSGLTVYPGFIDALTNIGVQTQQPQQNQGRGQGGPTAQQSPQPTSNSNYPAGLRPEDIVIDDIKGGDSQFESVRNAGFAAALTTGRTGIFNGQSAVINLAGETVSAIIIKAPFAEHVAFRTVGGGQYPGSLLGTFSALRQMLLDARRLQQWEKQYAADPRGIQRPQPDKSLEALYPVINRQMPVVFYANSENEITRALDVAKEFNLKAIIAGGQESWKVADRLKAQDVPVLLSVNFPKRTTAGSPDADPESLEVLRLRAEAPKGAGRLAQAGVKFAFVSDGLRTPGDFFTNAGKAVESGLNKDAAIRAMTLGSAEILGVSDRLGSVDKGKIADLTVVKGDLLGKDRAVRYVFVDGKLFEQKEQPAKRESPRTGTPNGNVANVGGSYAITIEVPGQTITGTLNLVQQGTILTGEMVTQLGTTAIKDGKVTAEGFNFSGSVEYGGSVIEIVVKGSVTGNNISGSIDSPQGVVPFTGTRNP